MGYVHMYKALNVYCPKIIVEPISDRKHLSDSEIRQIKIEKRANIDFFEKIFAIIPYQLRFYNMKQLVRILEIAHTKKVGTDALYYEFYFYIEKSIHKLTYDEYRTVLKVTKEREYIEDPIFWIDFMWPWIYQQELNQ